MCATSYSCELFISIIHNKITKWATDSDSKQAVKTAITRRPNQYAAELNVNNGIEKVNKS